MVCAWFGRGELKIRIGPASSYFEISGEGEVVQIENAYCCEQYVTFSLPYLSRNYVLYDQEAELLDWSNGFVGLLFRYPKQ